MCSSTLFQHWQAESIRTLLREGHQCVLLIRDTRETEKKHFLSRLGSYQWNKLIYNLCHRTIFKAPAKNTIDFGKEFRTIPVQDCLVDKKGFSEYFSPGDIHSIRSYQPDFILRFGFGIIRGPILEVAQYGVWSFHHDDEMKYRGGPPAFWGIWRNDPVTGAILQRLTDKLDDGIVLQKGYFKTIRHSYRANLEQVLEESAPWPAKVASFLSNGGEPGLKTASSEAKIFRVPGNFLMVLYLAKLFINKIRFHFNDLFLTEFWHSGVINKPAENQIFSGERIHQKDITWIPSPGRSEYYADPSALFDAGQLRIYFEDFRYKTQSAGISCFTLDPSTGKFSEKKEILPGNPHLSYPFVFLSGNTIYCIPESCIEKRVRLYRYDETADRFVPDQILLDGIDAVDPTLVNFENRWWLFFTRKRQSNTHLYIYWSDDLKGPYQPHPQNPVKTDVRCARPAGKFFTHEGTLYRPSQDCSLTYGNRVVINKILELTTESFREEPLYVVGPLAFGKYKKGFHTFNSAGPFTIFDAKCYRFDPVNFRHRLMLKLKRGHDQ
jgi:hypothetical protein